MEYQMRSGELLNEEGLKKLSTDGLNLSLEGDVLTVEVRELGVETSRALRWVERELRWAPVKQVVVFTGAAERETKRRAESLKRRVLSLFELGASEISVGSNYCVTKCARSGDLEFNGQGIASSYRCSVDGLGDGFYRLAKRFVHVREGLDDVESKVRFVAKFKAF